MRKSYEVPSSRVPTIPDYTVNGVDVSSYRKHPRMMELRYAFLHERLTADWGEVKANEIVEAFCTAFQCDPTKMRAITNRLRDIRKVHPKTTARYAQEIIFMGWLDDESLMVVADKYLRKDRRRVYGKAFFKIDQFVTPEWLALLDDEPIMCGIGSYRVELERFMDHMYRLVEKI